MEAPEAMRGHTRTVHPWRMPVALLAAASVLSVGVPARAFPDARVNLIRISSEGVTAMPDLDQARLQVWGPAPAPVPLISQAAAQAGVTLLTEPTKPLVMTFAGPLPAFDPDDYVSIRIKSLD